MARRLIVEVVGDTSNFEASLGRAAAASTGFVGALKSKSAELSAVGASMTRSLTLPFAAIGAAGTKMAMDFQSSMELLHTQAGVSQKAVDSLSKSVLSMAGSVATTPETLSTGLYHLASQGLRGAQALDALRIAAEGAKVGQANLEDVTNALGAVLVSGIKGSSDYTRAMGELNATVGAGDMHMQDLADAMGTGLPAKAALAGVSLRDVSAALAVFGDNNIRGAEAGTQLNSAIRLMEGPSHASAKAMASIGLSAKDLGDTLRNGGLVSAIELLKQHLSGISQTEQFQKITQMFGGRQAGGVMLLLDQLDRLKTKVKEVGDGGDKFASDWQAYTQTTAYKMSQLGASMSAAGISIGNILLPFVSKAVNALSGLAQKFQALPGPVKDFAVGAGLVLAVIGPMISSIGALGGAIAFLLANPIVLAVAAIAGLAAVMAAAVLAPQKLTQALEGMGLSASTSAKIVAGLQEAFAVVQRAAEALVGAIRDNWGTIQAIIKGVVSVVSGVVGAVEAVWRRFGSTIMTIVRSDWNFVKATISNDLQVIRGIVDVFAGVLHGRWSQVWKGIKEIVSGTWHEIEAILRNAVTPITSLAETIGKAAERGIVNPAKSMIDFVKTIPGKVKTVFADAGKWLVDAGAALVEGFAAGIESKVKDAVNAAKHLADSVKGFLGKHFGSTPYEWGFTNVGLALAGGIADGFSADVPRLLASLESDTVTLTTKFKAAAEKIIDSTFKNASGAPVSDSFLNDAITASLAANPNAAGAGGMNLVTGAGSAFAYQGPTMPSQIPKGNVNVTVNVHGSVMGSTPDEIAQAMKYETRDALLTIAQSEPSIFRGKA